MYGKVNPTGCTERYGLIQVRLDLFLESGDVRYNDPRFYQIDTSSAAYLKGYTGKVDKEGQPRDLEAYAAWEKALPRIWLPERCFHHHFIYLDPYSLKDEQITDAMALHLPNFYKAWAEERDKVQGGMRHGWDVAARRPRPTRYNVTQPELYTARKAECLSKVDILKVSSFATQVTEIGETFPSTDIDVGDAATNRASSLNNFTYTLVAQNNAANDTGALDTVEVWLYQNASAFWAGTFSFSGSTGTCRDSANLGSVTSGAKRTHTGLDIDVSSGDLIGCKDKTGTGVIEAGTGGNFWRYLGECIDPSDSATFSDGTYTISLYGTGETGGTAYSETSAVSLGVAATATKVAGYLRSPALSLGVAATATRAVTYLRSSAVGLGLASLGAHSTGKAITSAVSLGIAATASRTVAWGRSSSVGLGLAATATRNIAVARVSAVALGLTAAATRGFAFVSAVSLGVTSLGARAKSNVRSAALSLGITVTAVRDLPHLVYTAIGSIYRAYQAIARIFRTYSADASIERTYTADAKVRK